MDWFTILMKICYFYFTGFGIKIILLFIIKKKL